MLAQSADSTSPLYACLVRIRPEFHHTIPSKASFPEIEHIHIRVCSCCSAPKQLLKAGLFACSPQHPSLAVDVEVLEFARRLFVNMPPNNTAWCNTLETFLSSRGYKLRTRVCL